MVRFDQPAGPVISGIMICQGYTQSARLRLKHQIPGVRLRFRSWDQVLRDTERLHRGWLAVATKRAKEERAGE